MEPYKYLIIFLVISVAFSCIYVLYTIPEQIKKGGISYPNDNPNYTWIYKKTWSDISIRFWTAFLAYLIIVVISLILIFSTVKVWKLFAGEAKRILQFFGLTLFFYMLGALAMVIGTGVLIVMKQSYRTDVIYGLIYPCSLPIAMMYSGIAPVSC